MLSFIFVFFFMYCHYVLLFFPRNEQDVDRVLTNSYTHHPQGANVLISIFVLVVGVVVCFIGRTLQVALTYFFGHILCLYVFFFYVSSFCFQLISYFPQFFRFCVHNFSNLFSTFHIFFLNTFSYIFFNFQILFQQKIHILFQ